MNSVINAMLERKSVRKYTGKKATVEQLELIIKAGMAAPSAKDKRPWGFIIINDEAVLKKLSDSLPYAKMTAPAGSAIVVTGNLEKQNGGEKELYWVLDCSAAVQNILLAAEAIGLGAVWTAVFPNEDRIVPVKKILELPEKIIPLALIPIGTPEGSEKPKDKFNKENIHYNKW